MNPAVDVPSESWETPLVLAYYIGRSYEGTAVMAAAHARE